MQEFAFRFTGPKLSNNISTNLFECTGPAKRQEFNYGWLANVVGYNFVTPAPWTRFDSWTWQSKGSFFSSSESTLQCLSCFYETLCAQHTLKSLHTLFKDPMPTFMIKLEKITSGIETCK